MRQRDIYELYPDPIVGSEQSGRRLAVIISGNLVNERVNTVIAIPMTSQLKRYPGNLILEPTSSNGLTVTSEVMSIHVRSVAKERLGNKLGSITKAELETIKVGLDKILRY